MRLGQLIRLARLLNRKSSRAITSLEILETVDRNTRSTSSELQQTRLLLGVPAADTLPEVLDNFVVLGVAAVIRVLLPVVHVNIGDTTNQEFEFALVKDVYEIGGDELVETGNERLELLLNALLDPPLGNKPTAVSKLLLLPNI
jgi:hypothetical protein